MNGSTSSYGTALYLEKYEVFVTSQLLIKALGATYSLAYAGKGEEDLIISDFQELSFPAKGIAVDSIEPAVYRLEFHKSE